MQIIYQTVLLPAKEFKTAYQRQETHSHQIVIPRARHACCFGNRIRLPSRQSRSRPHRALLKQRLSTMAHSFRPLPTPPGPQGYLNLDRPMGSRVAGYSPDPYYGRYMYGPSTPRTPAPQPHDYEERPSVLSGGTLLHKGFYDLLSLIPTPSPSRLLQGWTQPPAGQVLAGPRYEEIGQPGVPGFGKPIPPTVSPPTSPPTLSPPPKKGRRLSKDMVSKPMNFVCVPSTSYKICTHP